MDGMKNALARAAETLVESKLIGLIWLDDDLRVSAKKGRLVDWAAIGEPYDVAIPPLYGLADDIRQLRGRNVYPVSIPSIAFSAGPIQVAKLSIEAFWEPRGQEYVVMCHRLQSQQALERELHRQMDATQLARSMRDQSVAQLSAFVDNAPAPMAMLDAGLFMICATPAWKSLFGDAAGERGAPLSAVLPALHADHAPAIKRAMAGEHLAVELAAADLGVAPEAPRALAAQLCPWRNADGAVGGVMITVSAAKG